MTTKVTVAANHGWPVDVTPVSRTGGAVAAMQRVPANETRDFYVHDGQDLIIREVQPADQAQTEGQYRVGATFNPSASGAVDLIKMRAAELIDFLQPIAKDPAHPGGRCASIAMTEIESAAMWAVKAVTKPAR